jgi:hypothetical protein
MYVISTGYKLYVPDFLQLLFSSLVIVHVSLIKNKFDFVIIDEMK